MKKLLPLVLVFLFFQASAQVTSTMDPETGQAILEDCDPEIILTRPVVAGCCDTLTLTDIYARNAGLSIDEKKMVKEFVKSCRPFLHKFYAIYFFLGNNEDLSNKFNFLNPYDNEFAFTLQFPNKAVFGDSGVFFDANRAQFADTRMRTDLMLNGNVGASYYLLNTIPGGAIISNGSSAFSIWRRDGDGRAYGYIDGATSYGAPVPDYRGFGTIQRNENNIEVYNSGDLSGIIGPSDPGSTAIDNTIKISQNYTTPQQNSLAWSFFAVHETLTAAEQQALFEAVELLQVEKERNVPAL